MEWLTVPGVTFGDLDRFVGLPIRCAVPPSLEYRDVYSTSYNMKEGIYYHTIEFADGDIATGVSSDPVNLQVPGPTDSASK